MQVCSDSMQLRYSQTPYSIHRLQFYSQTPVLFTDSSSIHTLLIMCHVYPPQVQRESTAKVYGVLSVQVRPPQVQYYWYHTPHTMHTMHHTPYSLHLTFYTIHHTPYTFHITVQLHNSSNEYSLACIRWVQCSPYTHNFDTIHCSRGGAF